MGEGNQATPPNDPQSIAFDHPGVTLWLARIARTHAEVDELAGWLSGAESARARRFGTDALRQRWIAGRATLRLLLGRVLSIPPAAVEIRRGIRGRPELATAETGIDFNVSHTGETALFGIARGLPPRTRIGIDIERRDREVGVDRLGRKFLTASERATLANLDLSGRRERFLRYWTCKEAMSKATGDGLIAPFGRLEVVDPEHPRLAGGPPPYLPDRWTLHAVAVPAAWFASVAIWRAPE